jgi:hypothetical protein
MATHPFARRQWLGFSALGCVLGASAASGIGTFANLALARGFGDKSRFRSGLPAGGGWIRTFGPASTRNGR